MLPVQARAAAPNAVDSGQSLHGGAAVRLLRPGPVSSRAWMYLAATPPCTSTSPNLTASHRLMPSLQQERRPGGNPGSSPCGGSSSSGCGLRRPT
jgi:hypothetical protein